MKFFKKCMMCGKSLWKKYDTFQMDTADGKHEVYLCRPQCWKNEWENVVEEDDSGFED